MPLILPPGARIVAATHNAGKARELAALLEGRFEVLDAGALGLAEPEETEQTFTGNALVKASDEVKAHCPTTVSFAPTVRLGAMQQRLQALVDAVNIVSPPLDKFYASLNDEQKSRFNGIQPPAPQNAKAPPSREAAASPQAQCNSSVLAWPSDQIDRVVHPNDAQRTRLDALQSAAAQAADTIKTACPTELPATPPDRLALVGKRMEAILQAVKTVRPALSGFYDSLSDEQKARFDGMGRQLFAAN